MMEFKTEKVDIEKVSNDEFFRISTNRDISDLIRSVKEEGLLTPPLLALNDGVLKIVSGFRRVDAAGKAGLKTITARIAENADNFTLVKYAVLENRTQRELNIVEQSISLFKLKSYFQGTDFIKTAASVIGIGRNPKLFEKLEAIQTLPQSIMGFVADEVIPLPIAIELSKLDSKISEKVASIFNELKISLNIQREVLTNLIESAKREKINIDKILESDEIFQILNNSEKNRNEKARDLRDYLKRRRYPSITEAFDKYAIKIKKLNLKNLKLVHPPDFEGTNYGISLTFSSMDELKRCSEELSELCKNPDMEDILKREF